MNGLFDRNVFKLSKLVTATELPALSTQVQSTDISLTQLDCSTIIELVLVLSVINT